MLRYAALCIAAFGLLGPFQRPEPTHPEWGPGPPVAPMDLNPLSDKRVYLPMTFPLIGPSRYLGGFGANRGKFLHTGIDIKANKMTPIVAPVSGILGMKPESFWIWTADGWAILGTHLNDDNLGRHDHAGDRDVMFAPNLVPGEMVLAGQFIGYVGESGDATTPHLHFEIYVPGPGTTMSRVRNPIISLQAATRIKHPISTLPDQADAPRKGIVRLVGCVRGAHEHDSTLTLILTDVVRHDGFDNVITSVRFKTVKLSPAVVESVGGWSVLKNLKSTQRVSVFVADQATKQAPLAKQIRITDKN